MSGGAGTDDNDPPGAACVGGGGGGGGAGISRRVVDAVGLRGGKEGGEGRLDYGRGVGGAGESSGLDEVFWVNRDYCFCE